MKRPTFLILALVLLAASAWGQVTTGSITAGGADCLTAGRCVSLALNRDAATVGVVISGTWVATNQFEGSANNGGVWTPANATPMPGGTGVNNTTANGTWRIVVAGLTNLRVRASAYTNGTATVNIQASPAAMAWNIDTPCPVPMGCTGLTGGTSGGILGFPTPTTLASSVLLGANEVVVGGGAGATPVSIPNLAWDNTNKQLQITANPASTNTILDVLKLTRSTTGTAGNGIGTGLVLYAEDASGNIEEAGRFQASFPIAAHATQTGRVDITAMGAAAGTGLSILNDATATRIGIGTAAPDTTGGAIAHIANPLYSKAGGPAGVDFVHFTTRTTDTNPLGISLGAYISATAGNRAAFLQGVELGSATYRPIIVQPLGGKVGFGSSTIPTADYEFYSAGSHMRFTGPGVASPAGIFEDANSKLYIADYSTGTKGIVLDLLSGTVGIGTAAPASAFSVGNSVLAGGNFQVNSSGLPVAVGGIATVANGVPAIYGTVDLTAQTSAIGATTIYANPATPTAGGQYRVCYLALTKKAGDAVNLALQLTFTTPDNSSTAQSIASANVAINTGGAYTQGCPTIVAKASTNIQYATTLSGGIGAGEYSLWVKVEKL